MCRLLRHCRAASVFLLLALGLVATASFSQTGPDTFLPLKGKTALVVPRWGIITRFDYLAPDHANPPQNAVRIRALLRQRGRYALVEDAAQADLIFMVTEWTLDGVTERGRPMIRLEVFRGGVLPLAADKPLWSGQIKPNFALHKTSLAEQLTQQFLTYVEKLATTATPESLMAVKLPTEPPFPADAERAHRDRKLLLEQLQSPAYFEEVDSGWDAVGIELLSAKTIAVQAFGSRKNVPAAGIFIGFSPPAFYSNADRAREFVIDELRKWGRYQVVDDVEKADIVLHMYVWDSPRIVGGARVEIGQRLVAILGSNQKRAGEVVWCVRYIDEGDWSRVMVYDMLRKGVERRAKELQGIPGN